MLRNFRQQGTLALTVWILAMMVAPASATPINIIDAHRSVSANAPQAGVFEATGSSALGIFDETISASGSVSSGGGFISSSCTGTSSATQTSTINASLGTVAQVTTMSGSASTSASFLSGPAPFCSASSTSRLRLTFSIDQALDYSLLFQDTYDGSSPWSLSLVDVGSGTTLLDYGSLSVTSFQIPGSSTFNIVNDTLLGTLDAGTYFLQLQGSATRSGASLLPVSVGYSVTAFSFSLNLPGSTPPVGEIPVPPTLWLLLAGLMGIGGSRVLARRR